MILVDTSVWIEFLKNNGLTACVLRRLLEDRNVLAVECVFGELLQGAKNRRERELIVGYWDALPRIEEGGLWIEAGTTSGRENWLSKGLGLIDSLIIVAARSRRAMIWTLDKKIFGVLRDDERFDPPARP